ncbi:MAG: hypothetical protein BM564_01645 [Bacteroidetes bacterium MedPE-SWsnd-G2]|nr:MAG: hypothetical protein BM564_01645 [Bacteroidetes bacterium MedPE-SWsnd-G2]
MEQFSKQKSASESFKSPTVKKSVSAENSQKPTSAFTGASWACLVTGIVAFCVGLWNSDMQLNERGYYFTILLFGLFAAISVQKSVRDKMEGLKVTDLYYGLSWFAILSALCLLVIGLWNAELALSEKGFYGMSYLLSLFASVSVQKNTRDNMIEVSDNVNSNQDNFPL